MKKRTLFLIGTAAAAGIYSAITGKGLFNKPRFKEQHERVANYVETHYPNAVYTPIEMTANGWVTVIRRIARPNITFTSPVTETAIMSLPNRKSEIRNQKQRFGIV